MGDAAAGCHAGASARHTIGGCGTHGVGGVWCHAVAGLLAGPRIPLSERLAEHFEKHGVEFPGASQADYLALAQKLRDAPVGGDVLETVRPADGVISRFDRATGAFLAVDADGTIRTFFKPNDGESYFRRQANRRPSS